MKRADNRQNPGTAKKLAVDSGLISLEFALLVSVIIGSMTMVSFAGRVAETRGRLSDAVSEAARAASLRQNPEDAGKSAMQHVQAGLSDTCTTLDISTDVSNFKPDGWVRVTASCEISIVRLALFNIPGDMTFTVSRREVVDRHRSSHEAIQSQI